MSIKWHDLSAETRRIMFEMGDFGPNPRKKYTEIFGWGVDSEGESCRVYLTASQLFARAQALIEVGRWLNARAEE